ncbi:MAG TPA: DNA gyrase inhibitor YacG [Rhizomicrobium sp.]|jgi:hypothetical protein
MSPAPESPNACSVCSKPVPGRHAPFCSKRCADIDLGRWLKGTYAIPGSPDEGAEEAGQPGSGRDEASEE